jgi:small subunit ribosomal protein S6
MLMIHPDAKEARHGEIIDRVRSIVEGGGGRWIGVDDWGRRKLAYEIDHQTEAHYYVLGLDSEPAPLDEATRVLAITDGVMRFMATLRPKQSRKAAGGDETATDQRSEAQAPA